MRPRPSVVSAALVILALIHASWGLRMLSRGELVIALSQLVSAGGLLLAGAAATSRPTFSTAMGIAAAATTLRVLVNLGSPGPWLGVSALLALGMGMAAWAARRLDAPGRVGVTPAVLRGGFVAMALAYLGFLGLGLSFGSAPLDQADLVLRVASALSVALFLDAPRVELPERKALARDAPVQGQ